VVADVVNLDSGTLDIAALATLAVDPLAALIGNFRSLHPGVSVSVVEPDSASEVSTLVSEGTSEIGLAHLPLMHQSVITHELEKQELLFVLPPHSDVDGDAPLAASALTQIPLVLSPPGTSTRILLEAALSDSGVSALIAVQTSAREAIVPLVLAGAGAALLPAPIAEEARRRGAVVRAADPPITRRIGLIHRNGPLSPAARVFTELAIDSELTLSESN
jgi:DNA-binding transcriptional LysR family regulator